MGIVLFGVLGIVIAKVQKEDYQEALDLTVFRLGIFFKILLVKVYITFVCYFWIIRRELSRQSMTVSFHAEFWREKNRNLLTGDGARF